MKKLILLLALPALCSICSLGQNSITALTVLKRHYPMVKWITKSQIRGDFDYDGITDYALRGDKNGKFIVGIVKGELNGESKNWKLEFSEDAGDQDGLCSVKTAVITIDDIDGDYINFAGDYLALNYIKQLRGIPKNSKGIIISDGKCDSFHIFWDRTSKQFTWWRV